VLRVFAELLRERLRGIVEVSAEQIAALEAHYELLVRWNKTVNLTTITSLEEAVERHYCESLFLGAHLPAGSLRVVDVGSGAGFPGFPVAILRPDCTVALVESHQRKAVFLREASRKVGNVRVIAKRAEEVEEEFDHLISRAVSYEDLRGSLKRLAPIADLLTGAEVPADLGMDWEAAVAAPWGKARFLRIGRRKVSRETSLPSSS
jgi:16S rRNA (guanine(527)-N(7))-methyltransferase RsmG